MSDASLDAARAVCQQLVADLTEVLVWEWDGRFMAALAAFEIAHAPAVEGALDRAFEGTWGATDVEGAPARVRDLCGRLGGLRAGQQMRTTSPDGAAMVYCAWWPWGGGNRVSIRIGIDGGDDSAVAELRGWFGL